MENVFKLAGTVDSRIESAIQAFKEGRGVLVLDDEDRENEGDLIFAASTMTVPQMAQLIRYGSGIVCLCIEQDLQQKLQLPYMVVDNTSVNQTAFTISIEAAQGVTTGVSATDRITTIRTAIAPDAQSSDLHHPGHVFPLVAHAQGVRGRRGHTESSVCLSKLAGLGNTAVLCEITNDDGTMARGPEIVAFGEKFNYPVITVEDLASYVVKHGLLLD